MKLNSRVLIAILLVTLLSGCGTVKQWKENRQTKSDSTSVTTTTVNTATTTKVSETVDTTVTVKGNETVAVRPIESLLKGDTIKAENNGTIVSVVYNPTTGSVTAIARTADRQVPVKINRTTETSGTTATKTDYKSVTSSKEAVRTRTRERESSGGKFWWGMAVAIILMFLLVIGILLRRMRR